MPKREKILSPNIDREDILKKDRLDLSEIPDLIGVKHPHKKLFYPPKGWKESYFQSPVNKVAYTLDADKAFKFSWRGTLENLDTANTFLLQWLGLNKIKHEATCRAIRMWLEEGRIHDSDVLDRIAKKLRDETLTNHALYNQPVCRLVRRDQLRYDPDYQIIYQVTPGQSRLLKSSESRPRLDEVSRNQRVYWGISEVFQSLVAMFDSDLGRIKKREDENSRPPAHLERLPETKEFIRIEEKGELAPLAPAELNMYSPLRFWSPPPAFARSVFHMIFWRSVITNRDLYHRPVIKQGANTVEERARFYYVIINWFNAAKYRIASYDQLLEALVAIARLLSDKCKDKDPKLSRIGDLLIPSTTVHILNKTVPDLFYRKRFPHTKEDVGGFPRPTIKLPFKSAASDIWELARRYQSVERRDEPTRVSHFLKFIRDRALEVILWSKYQMEIRSVGIIPVQHLYRIEIMPEGKKKLLELTMLYQKINQSRNSSLEDANETRINEAISEAIESKAINQWVQLVKIYGGLHREIIEMDDIKKKIAWLVKPRRSKSWSG
jgi:hypothetical protein